MEQSQNITQTQSDDLRWVQLKAAGDAPPVMFGHSAVIWKDSMYIFAGYSFGYLRDLFHFDFVANEWNMTTTSKSELPAHLVGRQYHTSVVYDDQMWILMGAGPGQVLKELFTYNFRTHVWTPIPINDDDFPPTRYLQSAVVYKDAMWIFGGKSNTYNNDCINDMHRFDFKTLKWSEIKVPSYPRPAHRRTHSAVIHNDCMYIFSGWNGTDYYDDLWEFNFELRRWTLVHTLGDKPTGRQLHTGVMYDGEMWVFGGFDSKQYYNDLYKFNFETCIWTKYDALEPKPSPRNAHSAVVYESAMYILGGNNFFDSEDSLWKLELPKRQRFSLNEQLANDFYGLFTNKRMTDIQVTINGKELQLHRFMLLARCPKLLELIEAGRLLQFDLFLGEDGAELLDNVIEFIYTDRLSVFRKADWEKLLEVSEFAQAVNFEQLVHACEYMISARARVDTVMEIKARAASAPRLLAWCKYFVESTADIRDPSEMVPLLFEPKEEEAVEEVRLTYEPTLAKDMLHLYSEQAQADLTIVTQERNFPVHRSILLTRCPYFEGLMHFSQNTAERINHDLKISEEDFETILKFVYSSEVHFKPENFFSLISEVSFYMIDSEQFYEACFEHFQAQITMDNIATLCGIATQFPEMTSVKNCLFDFIKVHWTSIKHQIDGWLQMSTWKKEILDLTALYDVD